MPGIGDVLKIGGLIFAAGGTYVAVQLAIKGLRRDVNGVGKKQRRMVLVMILQAKTAEEKDSIARQLLGD